MNFKHGEAKVGQLTRLFNIWRGMLKRCNPSNNEFAIERYAARGITVCAEWQDYIAFRDWAIENGYADNLSIDRIDNDRGYSPDNCRWANRKMQARNRRTSRFVEIDGIRKTVAEWGERFGVRGSTFANRIKRGWSEHDAIVTPTKRLQGAY